MSAARTRHDVVLEALVELGPPLIEAAVGRRDTCILSTRVASEVLSRFGILSTPHPCTAHAGNRKWSEAVKAGRSSPAKVRGALSVGAVWTDCESEEGDVRFRWPGHLVLVTRSADHSRHLLDLTAGQFDMGGQLPFRPFCAPLLEWPVPHVAYSTPEGDAIVYQFPDDDRAWRRAPDWRHTETEVLVRALHAGVRHVLDSHPGVLKVRG